MRKKHLLLVGSIIVVAAVGMWLGKSQAAPVIEDYGLVGRQPKIRPDYIGVVIPPNIAPLNFVIQEPAAQYVVKIHGEKGQQITVVSKSDGIRIPQGSWRELIEGNAGGEVSFDVYTGDAAGRWQRFESFSCGIAWEKIDSHLFYRLIRPSSYYPNSMSIHQRNLETFSESVMLRDTAFDTGCLNCHSFRNNSPETMLMGYRSRTGGADYGSGTILVDGGKVQKLGSKFGYTSWHPSGRVAAYSINNVKQFLHSARGEIHDVVDLDSSIAYYHGDSQSLRNNPAIAAKDMLETYPTWSPDGKYLYFCSAAMLWTDRNTTPPENYDLVKYSLMRVSYDVDSDQWGEAETVLSSEETGLSILLPRISPDGRFLIFCMCQYGCFPVYQPSSDLYLLDLRSKEYKRLSVNSEFSESWHSWSSNSRWLVFSSKRRDGVFTRPFISYVDASGSVHKPFIVPQKDPAYYDSLIKMYTVPELATGPLAVSERSLARAIRSPEQIALQIPITMASPEHPASATPASRSDLE